MILRFLDFRRCVDVAVSARTVLALVLLHQLVASSRGLIAVLQLARGARDSLNSLTDRVSEQIEYVVSRIGMGAFRKLREKAYETCMDKARLTQARACTEARPHLLLWLWRCLCDACFLLGGCFW